MIKTVEHFKNELAKDGRTFKWFVREYLKNEVSYVYANMQILGNATLQPVVEDAILKYLKEVK